MGEQIIQIYYPYALFSSLCKQPSLPAQVIFYDLQRVLELLCSSCKFRYIVFRLMLTKITNIAGKTYEIKSYSHAEPDFFWPISNFIRSKFQ